MRIPKSGFFLFIICIAILTLVAIIMLPSGNNGGKIPLVWLSASVPVREKQTEDFNRLYPQYDLKIDPANVGITKVVVQCSANIGGDIIDFVNDDNINVYYDSGILMDLSPYADKMGFGLDTLPESVRPLCQVRIYDRDGNFKLKQYAYPMNYMHEYIIYNKNVFDKLKIPYPPVDLTWDEYITLSQKLTVYKNGSPVPVVFGATGVRFETILWEMGGRVMNEEGTRCELDSPQAVKAMQFYYDLLYKYKVEAYPSIKAGVVSTDGNPMSYSFDMLCSEKLAMAWAGRWYLMMMRPYLENQLKTKAEWKNNHPGEIYPGPEPFRLGACHVPRFKNGTRYTFVGGRMAGINALSPNRFHALNFLQYAAGPDYNLSICRIADSKPPHRQYLTLNHFYSKEYPDEKEVHDISIDATRYGKVEPRSPFINRFLVTRIMHKNFDKINNTGDLTPRDIEKTCQLMANEINTIIARNIERNDKMRELYRKMLSNGAPPAAMPIKE